MVGPRVVRINVTPVKSLRLHHPESIELGTDGAREDGTVVTGEAVPDGAAVVERRRAPLPDAARGVVRVGDALDLL